MKVQIFVSYAGLARQFDFLLSLKSGASSIEEVQAFSKCTGITMTIEEKSKASPQTSSTSSSSKIPYYELALGTIALVALVVALLRIGFDTSLQLQAKERSLAIDYVALGLLAVSILTILLQRVGPMQKIVFNKSEIHFGELASQTQESRLSIKQVIAELGEIKALIQRNAIAPATTSDTPVIISTQPKALGRPKAADDDQWNGRFGGKSFVEGFRLTASFTERSSDHVSIKLTVAADSKDSNYLVEFFLHQTFNPDRIRERMEGGVARLELLAWGGFTVGVWIPERNIELELNLAKISDAPSVVKYR